MRLLQKNGRLAPEDGFYDVGAHCLSVILFHDFYQFGIHAEHSQFKGYALRRDRPAVHDRDDVHGVAADVHGVITVVFLYDGIPGFRTVRDDGGPVLREEHAVLQFQGKENVAVMEVHPGSEPFPVIRHGLLPERRAVGWRKADAEVYARYPRDGFLHLVRRLRPCFMLRPENRFLGDGEKRQDERIAVRCFVFLVRKPRLAVGNVIVPVI